MLLLPLPFSSTCSSLPRPLRQSCLCELLVRRRSRPANAFGVSLPRDVGNRSVFTAVSKEMARTKGPLGSVALGRGTGFLDTKYCAKYVLKLVIRPCLSLLCCSCGNVYVNTFAFLHNHTTPQISSENSGMFEREQCRVKVRKHLFFKIGITVCAILMTSYRPVQTSRTTNTRTFMGSCP